MGASFAEMPLVLFTTLAPIGTGAFIVLACAVFTAKLGDEQWAKVDKTAVIPAVFVFVGLAAVFASTRGDQGMVWPVVASVLAFAGVLAGRLVFYSLQASVELFF